MVRKGGTTKLTEGNEVKKKERRVARRRGRVEENRANRRRMEGGD